METRRLRSQFRALNQAIQRLDYSSNTQAVYWRWILRFLRFHGCINPREDLLAAGVEAMDGRHVAEFLAHLSTDLRLGETSQRQAFCALAFFYEGVVGLPLGDVEGRSAAPVLSPDRDRALPNDLARFVERVAPPFQLILRILVSSSRPLAEILRLRIIDFRARKSLLTFRDSRGRRVSHFHLHPPLAAAVVLHCRRIRARFQRDLDGGGSFAGSPHPRGGDDLHPQFTRQWAWQFLFPGPLERTVDEERRTVWIRKSLTPADVRFAMRSTSDELGLVPRPTPGSLLRSTSVQRDR